LSKNKDQLFLLMDADQSWSWVEFADVRQTL